MILTKAQLNELKIRINNDDAVGKNQDTINGFR